VELGDFLNSLSLDQWIMAFGSLFDPEHRRSGPFELWPRQAKAAKIVGERSRLMVPKARQLGVSELFAEKMLKGALANAGSEFLVVSRREEDAELFLRQRLMAKINALPAVRGITWPKVVASSKKHIVFSNDSIIRSNPVGSRSGVSQTLDGCLLDECGAISMQAGVDLFQLMANILPALEHRKGWLGMVGASEPGSDWNQLVRKAIDGGVKGQSVLFLPTDINPLRTAEWMAQARTEFPSETEFRAQHPLTIEDFFVVREGRIYPEFDVAPGGRHVREFARPVGMQYRLGLDWGYRDPTVLLETYWDGVHLWVYDCHYWQGETVDPIKTDIKQIINDAGAYPADFVADSAIFNVTGAHAGATVKCIGDILRAGGLPVVPSKKIGTIMEGTGAALGQMIHADEIIVHPQCEFLLQEMVAWVWDAKRKGEVPVDKNNHAIDALRYIVGNLPQRFDEIRPPREPEVERKGYAPVIRKKETKSLQW
jgi:hypothetical protein